MVYDCSHLYVNVKECVRMKICKQTADWRNSVSIYIDNQQKNSSAKRRTVGWGGGWGGEKGSKGEEQEV